MKAEFGATPKQFIPVVLTLESQAELDYFTSLVNMTNSASVERTFAFNDRAIWQHLKRMGGETSGRITFNGVGHIMFTPR